jgi:hypothetical protein
MSSHASAGCMPLIIAAQSDIMKPAGGRVSIHGYEQANEQGLESERMRVSGPKPKRYWRRGGDRPRVGLHCDHKNTDPRGETRCGWQGKGPQMRKCKWRMGIGIAEMNAVDSEYDPLSRTQGGIEIA